MRKTLNIDAELLKKAREASGAKTDTEAVRLGLKELMLRAAMERLLAYEEPGAQDIPRRRPEILEESQPESSSEKDRRIA